MMIEKCNRDLMLEHWNNRCFSITNMLKLGETDACIDGFIAEQIMSILRIKDTFGNKIPQPRARLFGVLSQQIFDFTQTRFDSIIDKMLVHGFIEELNGVCHWRKEPIAAMPLR